MAVTSVPRHERSEAGDASDAWGRTLDASRELLEQRLELLRLDVTASAQRGARVGLWGASAGAAAGVAWLAGVGLVYRLVADQSSGEVALGAIAAGHAVLAAALAGRARREARSDDGETHS